MLESLSSCNSWFFSGPICSHEYVGINKSDDDKKDWSNYLQKKRSSRSKNEQKQLQQNTVIEIVQPIKTTEAENETKTKTVKKTYNDTNEIPSTSRSSKLTKLFSTKKMKKKPNRKQTLLELANLFKQLYPDKWRKRDLERNQLLSDEEKAKQEKLNAFFDWYYTKQEQLKRKEKKQLLEQKPRIILQLKYQCSQQAQSKETVLPCEKLYENYSIHDVNEKKGFKLFKKFSFLDDDDEDISDELQITVVKGKSFCSSSKFDKCKIKCFVFDENGKPKHKMKTKKIPVSHSGKALWNHVFALRGYTQQDLLTSHIQLLVTAKSDDEKSVIGSCVLAGKEAKIWEETSKAFRKPAECEITHWDQAVVSPFTTIHAKTDLIRPLAFDTSALVTSLGSAFKL